MARHNHVFDPHASPLARELAEIRGTGPVGPVLRRVVGDGMAEKILGGLMRVRRFEGPGRGRSPSPGVRHQGTATVEFAPEPVRSADSGPVRRAVTLLLTVLDQLPECSAGNPARVISRRLWIGHQGGAKGAPRGFSLANRLKISVREIERYLVVFRELGVLRQWQPPKSIGERDPRLIGRRSGHPYACWQLETVPAQLSATLAAWWRRAKGMASPRPPVVAPSPRAPSSDDARARFMALIPAPDS